jgi:ribA/ribD-fused uncharacterized protein
MNRKMDTNKRVLFYEQEFYVLSNFSAFRLRWCGVDFDTAEHAYHFQKFHQRRVRGSIMNARSAHEAFKTAETHRDLVRPDWTSVRVDVMRELLESKADQHEYVRRKLLETGDRELIEDSWRDSFWGWGPDRRGNNMLGRLWMAIRTELREKVS